MEEDTNTEEDSDTEDEETVDSEESMEETSEENSEEASEDVDEQGRKLYKATCSDCGKECKVPFEPTEVKPVRCKDCFISTISIIYLLWLFYYANAEKYITLSSIVYAIGMIVYMISKKQKRQPTRQKFFSSFPSS